MVKLFYCPDCVDLYLPFSTVMFFDCLLLCCLINEQGTRLGCLHYLEPGQCSNMAKRKKISPSSNQKEYLIRILNAVNFISFPACCHRVGYYVFVAAIAKRPCVCRLWCVFRICHLVPSVTVCSRADCSRCVPMISTPVKCTELHIVQDVRVAIFVNNIECVHILLALGNMRLFPVTVCN